MLYEINEKFNSLKNYYKSFINLYKATLTVGLLSAILCTIIILILSCVIE